MGTHLLQQLLELGIGGPRQRVESQLVPDAGQPLVGGRSNPLAFEAVDHALRERGDERRMAEPAMQRR